jgi:D-tyrosyl-tRNA(Tyr) deacylase
MAPRYLVVVSDLDPVARAVLERWGDLPATGGHVDGAAIRTLGDGVELLRRPGLHIHDERLDLRLPPHLLGVPLVFPSMHRSMSGTPCSTVHPLGNFGASEEVGGAARQLVPAPARLMAATLRALAAAETSTGLATTYEATHHGPWLLAPGFFAEISYDPNGPPPPEAAVRALAELLRSLREDPTDRVVVGVGGGHYAPHFTDLALRRRWAFGHIVPRHALTSEGARAVRAALGSTPGAEGMLFARAQDAEDLGPIEGAVRLRENAAEKRDPTGSPSSYRGAGT